MNPAVFLPIVLLFVLLWLQRRNERAMLIRRILSGKGRRGVMLELMKSFIGKECLIYTLNSQLTGVVRELTAGGVLIENGGAAEIVNLDYIVRVREYPKGRNGKKKSVVLD